MQNNIVALTAVVATLAGSLGASLAATAETAPEDAKDYRTAVMTSLRGHTVAASMHVRGLVEDNGFLAAHAEGLARGAQELKHLFPAGSNVDDSEALPVIWEEPEEFQKAVENAEKATAAFSEAVAGGDQGVIGRAFRDVGNACSGCHDRFRMDKD
jgi:cytochrome c556